MRVEVVDTFGTDAKISRMARISYGKRSEKSEEDLSLFIGQLLCNEHLVPFEHCSVTFYIECPIYVARQIVRYRTAVISERSMRYCKPDTDGSFSDGDSAVDTAIAESYAQSILCYEGLIDRYKVPQEEARKVLPLGINTEMYFTINLRNLFHLLEQRCSSHAQSETRDLAEQMLKAASERFPITFAELKKLYAFTA